MTQFRRVLGLVTGLSLVLVGAAEAVISRSDFDDPKARPLCEVGLCASQFSPARVFDLLQKAALGDARGELDDFTRAVRLSPTSAYRWADLGEAEFNVRDYSKAEYAFSQALKAGPRSPVILMRAANVYFQIGDSAAVVRQLLKLLNDPGLTDYYESAFFTYSRLGLPVHDLLNQGLPRRSDVLSSLLTFWTKTHKPDEAVATWKWASSQNLIDQGSMGQFFTYLLAAGRQDEAQQLWQDYARNQQAGYRKTNWIFNPGFDRTPQLAPFDWNIVQRPDVEASRVQDVKYDGDWALRVRFSGETNTAYHQIFQDLVLPDGKYIFSVMLKSDQVSSDEGIRLHIFDWPTQAKLNFLSDTLTGTQDWKQVTKTLEVPAGVKVVRVEVARLTSGMFDNKIGGTTWIDHLELARQ